MLGMFSVQCENTDICNLHLENFHSFITINFLCSYFNLLKKKYYTIVH